MRRPASQFEAAFVRCAAQSEDSAPTTQVAADLAATDSAGSTLQHATADSSTACAASAGEPRKGRPRFSAPWRIDWATLLKRVWNTDALACSCGGRLKLVKLVTDEAEASEALRRAGLPSESPTFFDESPPDWD
jgi:hypothetical protein